MTGNAKKAGRVMGAMMTMKKIDVQALKNAAAG
jgi:predicted 3-demethylubiquinone-9 3-methyltransferase (glyoxalase superfamily)